MALAVAVLALWGLSRVHRVLAVRLIDVAERKATKAGLAPLDAIRASRVFEFQRYLVTAAIFVLDAIVLYAVITFVLRRFPFTRPWGESMRSFLLTTIGNLALDAAQALPGLFTALLIFAVVRLVVRLVGLWFDAVERGTVTSRWIYPDTARPSRRLVTVLLYLFAVVVAYPYIPGSETDAFKGVSVFLGLMVTFGSAGIINQMMSGLTITYSRSLRVGDLVRAGDVEGTVTEVGVLSTKITTLRREEVTVPNAVIVSQTITDYSRPGDTDGVLTPTSVAIGYDTPWRQVRALLLLAAERTPGLRHEPKPIVRLTALESFCVNYTLFVSLERQEMRPVVFDALHANILDLCNEHGVQIMTPNYEADPDVRKTVPKENWFAAPARPESTVERV
jgi:small-conductance mechanosensitive channel